MKTNTTVLILVVTSMISLSLRGQSAKEIVLQELNQQILELHDRKIKSMSKGMLKKISKCESVDDLKHLDLDAQKWLHQNFCMAPDMKMGANFEKLDEIKMGDDVYLILSDTFWCRVKGKPIELRKRIDSVGLYWKETTRPLIKVAPEGRGGIDWRWKLDISTRPHGTMHVGLDTKTQRFICYEHTVGLYYPEGDVLNRIRAEIVQDPDMAGIWIGKGRRERLIERTKKPNKSVAPNP
jgi:hypothetical protein